MDPAVKQKIVDQQATSPRPLGVANPPEQRHGPTPPSAGAASIDQNGGGSSSSSDSGSYEAEGMKVKKQKRETAPVPLGFLDPLPPKDEEGEGQPPPPEPQRRAPVLGDETATVTPSRSISKQFWKAGDFEENPNTDAAPFPRHNATNREIAFFWSRSGETVSRHFHRVLNAIIKLEDIFLRPPDGLETPPEIMNSSRYYPYFKDCICAIDGTHIRVKVPARDAPIFRGRKDYPTQNVLAACSFDLRFSYVLAGWEGTASDSRIMKNALTRRYPLKIPQGKYYLVDAGFMLKSGLITPFRGEQYHLKEYSRNPPRNARELFNHRHSSLRNVIERAFGVLKKRFPIIATTTEPAYGIQTKKKIVIACAILHNYLIGADPDDHFLIEDDDEGENDNQHDLENDDEENAHGGEMIRDGIAANMWADYTL